MKYQKLSKKALTCMYVKTLIWSVILITILLVLNAFLKDEWPAFITTIVYVLVGLRIVYSIVAPKIRYERYRYILTEEEFEVREGLIMVTTEIVPIERLHKIEVSSGPIFRAFGLKSVKATTAGGEIDVDYLENEVADRIAEHLKNRINSIAVEERVAEQQGDESIETSQGFSEVEVSTKEACDGRE